MYLLPNKRTCTVFRRVSPTRQPIGYLSFQNRPNYFSRAVSTTAVALSVWILLAGSASGAAGPVLWWTFDEGTGSTAFDSSGNGRDGTLLNGATWSGAGRIGGAISIGGGNQFVGGASADFMNGLTEFTMAIWVRPTTINDFGFITTTITGLNDDETKTFIRLDVTGSEGGATNTTKFNVNTTSGDAANEGSTNSVVVGEWHHYVLTWTSGQTFQLYVDGVPDVMTGFSNALTGTLTGNTSVQVGRGGKFPGSFTGLADELRIYDRALTPAEVLALFANVPPTVTLDLPLDGSTYADGANVSLSATATDDGTVSQVEFFANGSSLGLGAEAPPGTWTLTWVGATHGGYALTAVATDNGGATRNSAAKNITVGAVVSIAASIAIAAEPTAVLGVLTYWASR